MKTLINTHNFNYKGFEIIANDYLIAKEISNHSAFTKRVWTVGGKIAKPYKFQGEVYLTIFENGEKTMLKDFNPEIGFFIDYKTTLKVVNEAGFTYEHSIN